MSEAERAKYWEDQFVELSEILKAAPMIPNPAQLAFIGSAFGEYPDDWNTGKIIQSQHGLKAVPPICECETGADAWHRLTGGTADFSTAGNSMSVAEILNRDF